MKNKLLILLIVVLAVVLCFSACKRKTPAEETQQPTVTVTSIEVVADSVPTQVNITTTPDFSGIQVKVNYSDGSSKTVGYSDVTVAQLDTSSVGAKTVKVTYEGKTATFTVNVVDPEASAYPISIQIVPNSIATAYHLSQAVDYSKLQIEVTYSTGRKGVLSAGEYTYTAIDTTKEGQQTFTVTYTADPNLTNSITVNVVGIKNIQIISNSIKNKIRVGETLDTSGLKAVVTFANDVTTDVSAVQLTIGTIDTTTYGQKKLPVTYMGVTIEYPIEVVGAVSISVNKGSYPESIKYGGTYSAANLTGYVTYSDNSKEVLNASAFSLATLDTTKVGKQTVKVTYQGLETSLEVEVVGVRAISVFESSISKEVLKGGTLDTTQLSVNVQYTDGTSEPVYASELTVGTIDTSTAGDKKLAITYLDKTVEYTVKVCEVTSIEISGVSNTVSSGTEVDLSNMKVFAVYNDSKHTKVEVTAEQNATITTTVYPSDKNSTENRVLTVTYKGVYGEFSTQYNITATNAALVDIEIDYKTEVFLGGQYNKSNVTVEEVYANGTRQVVTGFTIAGIDTTKAGEQTLTVTYTKNGVTYEKQGTVKVCQITSISVTGLPESVPAGEDIDLSGIKVYGIYDDSDKTPIEIKGGTITNTFKDCPNFNKIEDKTFTITCTSAYGTFSTEVTVKASRPLLESITIDKYDAEVLVGTEYNKNSVSITAIYGNGDENPDVTGFVVDVNTDTRGTVKLTVTYTENGIERSAEVNVTVCSFEKLEIQGVSMHLPAGSTLNTDNMTIVGVYKTTVIPLDKQYIISTNADEVSANKDPDATINFKVVYVDERYGRVEGILPISAQEPVLNGITFSSYASAVVPGVEYNLANVTLNAQYGNGATPTLKYGDNGLTLELVNKDGVVTLVVTYTVGETTVTASVELRVAEVEKIIIKNPVTSVISAELIDISQMEVYKVYNDDDHTEVKLDSDDYSTNINTLNSNPNTTQNRTLTVEYTDNGKKHTADCLIETKKAKVDSITISTSVKEILYGEKYDLDNVTITATLKNGQTETIALDNTALVLEYNELNNQITASYTDGYGVTVYAQPVSIKVCEIENLAYESGVPASIKFGDPLTINVSDLVVYGIYNTTPNTRTDEALDTSLITVDASAVNVNVAGIYAVKISYIGANGSGETTVQVTVEQPAFTGIQITEWVEKIGIGTPYDTEKIVVNAVMQNGLGAQLTEGLRFEISTTTAGTTKLKAIYNDGTKEWTHEVDVEVMGVLRLEISGVATVVDKGTTLDTTGIKVVAVFTDNTRREVPTSELTITGVDTANGGDKTLKVTYYGFEQGHNYHVRYITAIDFFSGCADTIRHGHQVDLADLIIDITYSNNDKDQKKASEITGLTHTASGELKRENDKGYYVRVEVSYPGVTTIAKELTVINVSYIHALTGSIPGSVFKNAELSLDDLKITVVYDNNESFLVYYKDDPANFVLDADFDTSKVGAQAYTISYKEQGVLYSTDVTVIVRAIKTIEIVDKSVRKDVYVGETYDLSGLLVKVYYDEGNKDAEGNTIYSYLYVKYMDKDGNIHPDLTVNTISTEAAGDQTLTVTYLKDNTATLTVHVNAIPTNEDGDELGSGFIFGTLMPDELVARDSYKNNFKNNSGEYRVGDDNKYYFYLNVIQLDAEENIVEIDGKKVPTAVTITKTAGEGDNGTLTAVESADKTTITYSLNGITYVVFTPSENSYDFTEAAIGKTFELKALPAVDPSRYGSADDVTKTHTVTVVDGYNIYEAWELNIMTNGDGEITSKWGENYPEYTPRYQQEILSPFLKNKTGNNNYQRPTSLAGIVLHGNIDLTTDDFPTGYFEYYQHSSGKQELGIFDQFGYYYICLTAANPEFSIYGNYYSIYSWQLPSVASKGQLNNPDEYSSSALIWAYLDSTARQDVKNTLEKDVTANPFAKYKFNVYDLATRDNDPNSNDQSASERHMRGLNCYRVEEVYANLTNINVDAFMTSLNIGKGNTTVNIENSKLYNAWQTHIFAYQDNVLQRNLYGEEAAKTEDTKPGFKGIEINAKNSLLAKCGGPVIIAQTPDTTEHSADTYKANRGMTIDVKLDNNCEIYSYVTGQEAWFVANYQVQLATNIKTMNYPFAQHKKSQFLTEKNIQGVETVNIIMINMGLPAEMGKTNYGYNGRFTYGDTVGLLMNSTDQPKYPGKTPALDTYITMTGGKPPIFQTSNDATSGVDYMYAAETVYYNPESDPLNLKYLQGDAGDAFYGSDADYLAIYYQGMGILLEYYHD